MRENFTPFFSRFFRINTCDHVFHHWATIPSGISNVCNFEDLHKSRANRLARRGNIARVSDKLGQRADLCSAFKSNMRRYTKAVGKNQVTATLDPIQQVGEFFKKLLEVRPDRLCLPHHPLQL